MTEYEVKEAGECLKELRLKKRHSCMDIAEQIKRSVKYCSDIERGTCGMSLETLVQLEELHHVSLDYIVYGMQADSQEKQIRRGAAHIGSLNDQKRKVILDMLNVLERGKNVKRIKYIDYI